jgi:hypothetical protein
MIKLLFVTILGFQSGTTRGLRKIERQDCFKAVIDRKSGGAWNAAIYQKLAATTLT